MLGVLFALHCFSFICHFFPSIESIAFVMACRTASMTGLAYHPVIPSGIPEHGHPDHSLEATVSLFCGPLQVAQQAARQDSCVSACR
jgi:hypothetical protein